jgi:ABC-2 type transport system permease protein
VAAPHRHREIFRYRELLANLIRKELKVKYKNSALGFLWSLLNPLLMLSIYGVALGFFLRAGLPWFPFYLLSGILAWNLLTAALNGSTGAFVNNANLISKVYFPRAILPLSTVGASLVHFVLQLFVLGGAMLIFGYERRWDAGFVLLPFALIVEVLLVAGLGLALATLNVLFRDVQHLLEVGLLAWFWMSPIVYASAWVHERMARIPFLWQAYLLNPMTPIVLGFQRALYVQRDVATQNGVIHVLVDAPIGWYAKRLAFAGVSACLLVVVAWWLFHRLEGRLAEEL